MTALRASTLRALIATMFVVAACGDARSGDAAIAESGTAATTATTAPAAPAPATPDSRLRSAVVDRLQAAFSQVRSGPVLIEIELREDDAITIGTARVDLPAGLYENRDEFRPSTDTAPIVTEHLAVAGQLFLRGSDGSPGSAGLPFTELDPDPLAGLLSEGVFTAYGRVGDSLDRILEILDGVAFDAETSDNGGAVTIHLTLDPRDIRDFFASSGVEAVGGEVPDAATEFVFTISGDRLQQLRATGTHFHDGEALSVDATVRYEPIPPFELSAP